MTDHRPLASSVEDFAKRNGISRAFAYKENAAGRLKFRKVGKRTLVIREDEDEWRLGLPLAETAGAA